MTDSPEIGVSIEAAGLATNVHDTVIDPGGGTVLLIHGSGPGVSAWANWRLTIPALREHFRVIAPDIHHADRVRRLGLMGAVGVPFEITPGLDAVWGYEPSVENMAELLRIFTATQAPGIDDLARLRYEASVRPGVHEAYASMFPDPRQRWVDAMSHPDEAISSISAPTIIFHGREDRVIPLTTSLRLLELIPDAQLHVFGNCGHWTQIEHADEFARLLRDFLLDR